MRLAERLRRVATLSVALFISLNASNAGAESSVLEYDISITDPEWVVPSDRLPVSVKPQNANNNVAIAHYNDRLYMAWRSAPTHFATSETKIHIISSPNLGKTWEEEHVIAVGSDLREPYFIETEKGLAFSYFQSGENPFNFEPKRMWRIFRTSGGQWSQPENWGLPGEVPWEIKHRDDRLWMTSYQGNHYDIDPGKIKVFFKQSLDGLNWNPVDPKTPFVYKGGVSEVGFEFDSEGGLWGVTRNEDGDDTGFGSHLVYAPRSNLSQWRFPKKSDPKRYDSPRMFRHGEEVFLIARRDVGGEFDLGWNQLGFSFHKLSNLAAYSLRCKRTTLYRINRENSVIEPLVDLPGTGDTAFPSIVRLGPDRFLVANYTSPLKYPGRDWIWGQISEEGTQIYTVEIEFVPSPARKLAQR